MTNQPRKNAAKTRGRPFTKGNPGRPKGALNRTTVAVEKLLAGEGEALARKVVELALGGDMTALRMCLDRVAPPRRSRPIQINLPRIETAADLAAAQSIAIGALAEGDLTPDEAGIVMGVLEARRRTFETTEIEQRLTSLEAEGAEK